MLKTKQGLSFAVAAVSVLLLVACGDGVTPQSSDSETSVSTGTMTDSRDGQTYKTVTIGTQTWMAQNLNYETANSYCYKDSASYCTKYGRLYTWAAATTACPSGWHLPTKAEFETLFTAVGGQSTAGKVLRSISGWHGGGNGSDAFAFSALPAGYMGNYVGYDFEGGFASFWSSSGYDSYNAYNMGLSYVDDDASLFDDFKDFGFSVRCLKGYNDSMEESSSSSVTGRTSCDVNTDKNCFMDSRDGQTYKTVTIGTQTWMAQNLNYETANSYCYDDNASNCAKYGRLYTWEAATTACPDGWHLPTKAEFEILFTAVGGQSTAGKVLKSTSGWNSSGNGTDASAFSALPAGLRSNGGGCYNEGGSAYFWSSTEIDSDIAYNMFLGYDSDGAYLYYGFNKDSGFSVRCLKD